MPDVLRYAAVTGVVAAGGCLLAGRAVIPLLARAQCVAPSRYHDCPPLHAYQAGKPRVPTMGGLFVLGAGVLAAALSGGLAAPSGWIVLGATAAFGAIGGLDDWLKVRDANAVGVRMLPKLVWALAAGALVGWASGALAGEAAVIPWTGRTLLLGALWIPCAAVVLAGSAHAVNLTDGMDGLAAGCLAIAFTALGIWVAVRGPQHQALVGWCAALAGACLAFLWFNSFPAAVYLGDTGALGLGAALGAISVIAQAGVWLPIIGAVFVAEAGSVMLQVASYKWRGQRRIFRVAPLHHHVHLGGMSEPKVIIRFWLAGAAAAAIGLTAVVSP